MRSPWLRGLVFIAAVLDSGCANPDRVVTSNSPVEGVFLTVETYYGHGAPSPDFTKVYAHMEGHGRAYRILVLDGEELTIDRIIWNGPNDATFCLNGGFTITFRNRVTLDLVDTPDPSVPMHFRLDENCQGQHEGARPTRATG